MGTLRDVISIASVIYQVISRRKNSMTVDLQSGEEVESRNPLEGSGPYGVSTLLDIELRLSDAICLVKLFGCGIFEGCKSRTSGLGPMSGF